MDGNSFPDALESALSIKVVETVPMPEKQLALPWLGNILLYILGIAMAEVLTTLYSPVAGMLGHGLLLVILLVHCGVRRDIHTQRMLITLALVPLSRLLNFSIPPNTYPPFILYLVVGTELLIAVALALRYTGYTLVYLMYIEPYFSKVGIQVLIGLCGIGLGYVEFLILRPRPLIESFTLRQLWFPALIFLVFTGFLEEIIFRGLIQKSFVDRMGPFRGVVLVSLLYAVLHIGYHSALNLVFVFAVALFFGYAVLRTRSIVGAALAHGVTNIFLFLVFPFFIR